MYQKWILYAYISSSLFSILLLLYSVKNDVKKSAREREREKMPIHTLIMKFRCCKLLLFTLLPFVPFLLCCLRHNVYSICSVLSRSLCLWYSLLLTTTILYARIIISTFYTHTHFSSSHLTTRLAVHSFFVFFFFKFCFLYKNKIKMCIL
jgi:hypothetical protein